MKEIFKVHKSGYLISNLGRIKGVRVEYITPTLGKNGYLITSLPIKGKRGWYSVHRAVYETFLGEIPKGKVINHIDGNKQNNSIDNLECITNAENTQHAYDAGLAKGLVGEDNSMSKLSAEDFLQVCQLLMEGATNQEVGELFGIHGRYVSLIRHKRRWKNMFPSWYYPCKSLGNTGITLDVMTDVYEDCLTTLKNKDIAEKWSLDRSTISRIRSKKTWLDFIKYYETRCATAISGS